MLKKWQKMPKLQNKILLNAAVSRKIANFAH
jgi:hypothetical protein